MASSVVISPDMTVYVVVASNETTTAAHKAPVYEDEDAETCGKPSAEPTAKASYQKILEDHQQIWQISSWAPVGSGLLGGPPKLESSG